MVRLLALLGMVCMSDAYAGVVGRQALQLAAQKAATRSVLAKTAVVSTVLLLRQMHQAELLAKDQDTIPDQRRVERKDSSPDRVERGDTVGRSRGSSGSHRRDSWEKPTSVFDERNTGRRGNSSP